MKSFVGVAVLCLVSPVFAGAIGVPNFSFEQLGSAKIVGWDNADSDIPGWSSDWAAGGSCVESDWPGSSNGVWAGFVMNGDPSIFNLTDHVISAGEQFTLLVDAQDNWSASPPGLLEIALYFDVDGARTVMESTTVQTWWGWPTYTVNHTVSLNGVGQKVGIQLTNVTAGSDSSWIGLDNVRLEVIPEPTTIAELVPVAVEK